MGYLATPVSDSKSIDRIIPLDRCLSIIVRGFIGLESVIRKPKVVYRMHRKVHRNNDYSEFGIQNRMCFMVDLSVCSENPRASVKIG